MRTPESGNQAVLQFPTAAATLRAFAAHGLRKVLFTQGFEEERAYSAAAPPRDRRPPAVRWRDRFVGETAMALAGSGVDRVLLIQPCRAEPDMRLLRLPVRRGLWELLHEAYLCDVTAERTTRFGLGDWLEILYAQRRTGKLDVHEDGEHFQVRFVQGSIRGVAFPSRNGDGWLAGKELRARTSERIAHMLRLRHPECRFIERAAPIFGGEEHVGPACLDVLFREHLYEHLRHPFLERQVASHLIDTPYDNLKVITAGDGGAITGALRRPLELLLKQLGRSFGLVLIDAPPVSLAGPTGMLAGLADAALLLAGDDGGGSTAAHARAVEEMRRWGAAVIGVLRLESSPRRAEPR